MARELKGDVIAGDVFGLCLDSNNCFNWTVPANAVSQVQEAIGEPRNFRMDVSGQRLHFEGCIVDLDIKSDFSANAKNKMLSAVKVA